MELEEAIKHLKILKIGIGYLNSLAPEKDKDLVDIEAIDIVLKELDNRIPKEKIEEKKNWYQETMKYLCKNGIDLDKYERYEEVVNFCEELLNKE